MSVHEKVQISDESLSTGELFDFFAGIAEQLPRDLLDPAKVRWYNAKKSRLGKDLRELFARPLPEPLAIDMAEWTRFYEKHFGLMPDLLGLHVPAKPDYPCRAIVMVPQLRNNQVFDACTNKFPTWRYTRDLDSIRDVTSRPADPHVRPQGPYAVWVRDTVEADPDMAGNSANYIEEAKINTLTLKERLLLELKYHDETSSHLDIESMTLCAGSRDPDGNVPYVDWSGVRLIVDWTYVSKRSSSLRARVVVS